MKSWKTPTDEMVNNALAAVRKVTDRQYFFSRLKNPLWLKAIKERGYFRSPPLSTILPDGTVRYPVWPELQYLVNVCQEVPDDALEVVLTLPRVENPSIRIAIIDMALKLNGEASGRLSSQLVPYAKSECGFWAYRSPDLITHWVAQGQIEAALQLSAEIVPFVPDAEAEGKRRLRSQGNTGLATLLRPSPLLPEWEYRTLLNEGVRALAQKAPAQTVTLLLDATSRLVHLRIHGDILQTSTNEDHSEIWCRRLHGEGNPNGRPEETLVATLFYACERVIESDEDSLQALDDQLKEKRWKLFARLRQHLYARHPTERTKPWIREMILDHTDFANRELSYEFQLMIRRACEHFGEELLSEEERERVFSAIMRGSSKDRFRDSLGAEFTEELLEERQRRFRRKQMRPFTPVLFGEFLIEFENLENGASERISDEDYGLIGTIVTGAVVLRAPVSRQELSNWTDEEILSYVNEWEVERRGEDNGFVDVTIEALADEFEAVFASVVWPSAARREFWFANKHRIMRPIYTRVIVRALQERIREGDFVDLEQTLSLCEWILTHADQPHGTNFRPEETSGEFPDWHTSRRAVGDLVGVCLQQSVTPPISVQGQLASLIATLCTQFDRDLDQPTPPEESVDDYYVWGYNFTRSLALENLALFGLLQERMKGDAETSLPTTILDQRFDPHFTYPLAFPERAVLGRNFSRFLALSETWAAERRAEFFPQDMLLEWVAAFGALLRYNVPSPAIHTALKDEFQFALQHKSELDHPHNSGQTLVDILGQHLFLNFIWGQYPLGEESPLELFYLATDGDPGRWGKLFDYVGFLLRNTTDGLKEDMQGRLDEFIEWRLEAGLPDEIMRFGHWLDATCIGPERRLSIYSRIVGTCEPDGWEVYGQVGALRKMIPNHIPMVVECFAKLTDGLKDEMTFVQAEAAKEIIGAGLASTEQSVRSNAKRARENLLKKGHFDLLELAD